MSNFTLSYVFISFNYYKCYYSCCFSPYVTAPVQKTSTLGQATNLLDSVILRILRIPMPVTKKNIYLCTEKCVLRNMKKLKYLIVHKHLKLCTITGIIFCWNDTKTNDCISSYFYLQKNIYKVYLVWQGRNKLSFNKVFVMGSSIKFKWKRNIIEV